MRSLFLFLVFVIAFVKSDLGDSCTKYSECAPYACLIMQGNATTGVCSLCNDAKFVNSTNSEFPCEDSDGYIICMDEGKCDLRGIFTGSTWWRDILTIVALFAFVFFAALGGLGGGAFGVPILYLIGGFPFTLCSALSSALIFGVGLGNMFFFITKRYSADKKQERSIIDFDLALLVEPIILSGAMIGVLLNSIFPNWLALVIFIGVVLISAAKTTQKGFTMLFNENDNKEKPIIKLQLENHTKKDEIVTKKEYEKQNGKFEEVKTKTKFFDFILKDPIIDAFITKKDVKLGLIRIYKRFPLHVFIILIVAWTIVLTSKLLNGSKKVDSIVGIIKCTPIYWVVLAVSFVLLFLISYSYSIVFYFVKKNDTIEDGPKKENFFKRFYSVITQNSFPKLINEVQETMKEKKVKKLWTPVKVFATPAIFVLSGLIAALVGIGGSMINNPVLYTIGVPAELVIATSCFLTFFTASSTVTQYIIGGVIKIDYFLVLFFLGLGIAFAARISQQIIEQKFGRRSFIVLICGFSILAGGILTFVVGLINVIVDIVGENWDSFMFTSPC